MLGAVSDQQHSERLRKKLHGAMEDQAEGQVQAHCTSHSVSTAVVHRREPPESGHLKE